MKNLLVLFLSVSILGLVSCEQGEALLEQALEDLGYQKTTDYPASIDEYVDFNHAEEIILEVGVAEAQQGTIYRTTLSDDTDLFFSDNGELRSRKGRRDRKGRCHGKDSVIVDLTTLPTAITDYVTANYADATIVGAKVSNKTADFHIFLNTGFVLTFDVDGNFVEEKELPFILVEVADLPTVITDYITANYADATIKKALVKKEDDTYVVFLDTRVKVVFDADGNFVEEKKGKH